MNILFILPVLSDSYYRKRIEKVSELGIRCTVMGFERDHYKGKPWNIKTESLGYIKHGHYFYRIGTLLQSIGKIRKNAGNYDVAYAFNLDILFMSWLGTLFQSQKVKLVYDVADIRSILVRNGLIPSMLRALERFLLKRTSVVVVASPAYINGYFEDIQDTGHNFLVIENKVDKNLLSHQTKPAKPVSEKNITIGYFGMLRCRHSLRVLKQLVENSNGSIRLLLRGVFLQTEQFEKEFRDLQYANYDGPFLYPDDLGKMYSQADLVWAAHLHGETNKKWSISNRFYQACYFKCPIIAQEGTQDAEKVTRYRIGKVIDLNDIAGSEKSLKSVKKHHIEEWKKNMDQVPQEVFVYTDEHKKLIEMLRLS